ncbi:MAG: hypothetical protein KBF82_13785 [Chitinophagaceae bacterium]|nr:hypothetical protein [Chitinophagaceae bacterium]MBP9104931.1 hypothetical protein [Chitinophagaceae bacterium]
MKAVIIMFVFSLVVISSSFGQTKTGTPAQTLKLQEGIQIVDGKLQAKQGFYFQVSTDAKFATLINAKDNTTGGTFSCVCGIKNSGSGCNILVSQRMIACVGNCSCKITTTINSLSYTVDFIKGNLKKVE